MAAMLLCALRGYALPHGGQCPPYVLDSCFRKNDNYLTDYVIPAQAGIQAKSFQVNLQSLPGYFMNCLL